MDTERASGTPRRRAVLPELLRQRDFFCLWLANGLWWQAMWIEQLAIGWLILELTDSAWWLALIGFFRSIPLLLIGPFSAAITDRFRRRPLILVLQVIACVAAALTALLYGAKLLLPWHLGAFSLVSGSLWALDWPTRRALIPDLVGKESVVDAMMLENVIQSFTRISGPLGAGALLAWVGTGGGLWVLALSGLVAVAILACMRTQAKSPQAPSGLRQTFVEIAEGLRYIKAKQRIWGVILITVVMNVWTFPFLNLLPIFARDILAQGPMGLGLLGAASGVGALAGLVGVKVCRRHLSNEWIFAGGSIVSCFGLVVFAASTDFYLSVLLLLIVGVGMAGFSTMQSSVILVEAEDKMRGRAMGALVLAIGTGPFGRLQSGAMAEAWGAPLTVGSMAGWAGLATLAIVLFVGGFVRSVRGGKGAEEPA